MIGGPFFPLASFGFGLLIQVCSTKYHIGYTVWKLISLLKIQLFLAPPSVQMDWRIRSLNGSSNISEKEIIEVEELCPHPRLLIWLKSLSTSASTLLILQIGLGSCCVGWRRMKSTLGLCRRSTRDEERRKRGGMRKVRKTKKKGEWVAS